MTVICKKGIENALLNNRFKFYYQPQVSLITGKLVGAEALIRWLEYDGNVIYPDQFIEFAEENHLINKITLQIIDCLVEDMALFKKNFTSLNLSVNFSSINLESKELFDKISHYINSGKLDPNNFYIEITEQSLVNYRSERCLLKKYQEKGVNFAIDDFGVGYSNLASLIEAPISILKIDRSLVSGLLASSKKTNLVKEIIRLSNRLGLKVCAEGVEKNDEYQFLQHNGCNYVQGYLISKPIRLNDFINRFADNKQCWKASSIGRLKQAELEHIQWKHDILNITFKKLLSDKKREDVRLEVANNFKTCFFGRWFYEELKYTLPNKKLCHDIEYIHYEVHRLGGELLKKSNQDNFLLEDFITLSRKINYMSYLLVDKMTEVKVHKGLSLTIKSDSQRPCN